MKFSKKIVFFFVLTSTMIFLFSACESAPAKINVEERWNSFQKWQQWICENPADYEVLRAKHGVNMEMQDGPGTIAYSSEHKEKFFLEPAHSYYAAWVDSEYAMDAIRHILNQKTDPVANFDGTDDYLNARNGGELPLLVQLIRHYHISQETLESYNIWYYENPFTQAVYPVRQTTILTSKDDANVMQQLLGKYASYYEGKIYPVSQLVYDTPGTVLRELLTAGNVFVESALRGGGSDLWAMDLPGSDQWNGILRAHYLDPYDTIWRWNSFENWVRWKTEYPKEYAEHVKFIDKEKSTDFVYRENWAEPFKFYIQPIINPYACWLDSGVAMQMIEEILYTLDNPVKKYINNPDLFNQEAYYSGNYQGTQLPLLVQLIRHYGITRETLEAYDEWIDAHPYPTRLYRLCTPEVLDVIYSGDDAHIREVFCNIGARYYNGKIYTFKQLAEELDRDAFRRLFTGEADFTQYLNGLFGENIEMLVYVDNDFFNFDYNAFAGGEKTALYYYNLFLEKYYGA